jgi:hypothetical protein
MMNEVEFNNLCSHYKDTYEIHLATIKQRDVLFYGVLVILTLFSLQITSPELVNTTLSNYTNKQLDINIGKYSNSFGTLFWFLLFGFSTRYYQIVIQIERQYDYIYHLEEVINYKYPQTRVFTREGVSYLNEYPIFSNWVWLLYTLIFPLLILVIIVLRIYTEISNYGIFESFLILGFIAYLLIGTSTILYIVYLHSSLLHKFIGKFLIIYNRFLNFFHCKVC